MKSEADMGGNVQALVIRGRKRDHVVGPKTKFGLSGKFKVQHFDNKGNLKGEYDVPNGITDEGKNSNLDTALAAQTQITVWYIGLIDAAGYTAVAAADTMGSHAGWAEFVTYSESVRPTWGVGVAAAKSVTNATPEDFNITGTATLKGVFVVSNSTKSGSTGTLWSTALFAADIAVANTDLLKITYTVSIT